MVRGTCPRASTKKRAIVTDRRLRGHSVKTKVPGRDLTRINLNGRWVNSYPLGAIRHDTTFDPNTVF